jgi:hypothetical protein
MGDFRIRYDMRYRFRRSSGVSRAALTDFRCLTAPLKLPPMSQLLRVDTAALQAMATRWDDSVGGLNATAAPAGLGLSCQASAVAVNAAHADVTALTAALATRVGARATHVTEADSRYIANEADSANEMAAVARPVTNV